MERIDPRARSDAYGNRINRSHSALLANIVPWASILLGSILPLFFIASALPIMPPVGFLLLLGWRLVRPGLLPVWAGLPLGMFDDLFSGQPFGFGILTWSLALIAIELIETRLPWRSFWQDWFTAGIVTTVYLIAGWLLSGGSPTLHSLVALVPQLVLSILLFPVLARLIARLDQFRLHRWKSL
ncbi:rod shape-determining protein MreD [Qipengyuania sp. XHP0207]|uniref:rod shape-determining protein MreD n=1 Tax=Qipengyuania sp. XHP0207 TaxID=3038078 RepID=UPI00241DB390|nr:rod shape-determining protein MreD [Qipengyuania sp. XHP0207]MDG5749418.1 rod shape-determining protein MreD [Qipengyuania sp. XHP0207]